MATITIRRLDDEVKHRLRVRAAAHGHSLEEEARQILSAAVPLSASRSDESLWDAIRAIVDPMGGVEFDLPMRLPVREPPDFSGPEFDPTPEDE